MSASAGLNLLIGALFLFTVFHFTVFQPADETRLQAIAEFEAANVTQAYNSTGGNATGLDTTTGAVDRCVEFAVTIPLPILDILSIIVRHVFNPRICFPSGYQGDFFTATSIIATLALLFTFLLGLGIATATAGYLTGGEAGKTMATIGVIMFLCGLFIALYTFVGFFVIMTIPYIGVWVFVGVGFLGGYFIARVVFAQLSGAGAVI